MKFVKAKKQPAKHKLDSAGLEKARQDRLVKDISKSETNIYVKIYSPYKVYFNNQANSISANNDTGPFDVLPRHHNFISILKAGEVKVISADKDYRIKIDRGIMHVKNNQVIIFLDV